MKIKKNDIAAGEAIALAIYHLKYVLGEGQAGQLDGHSGRQTVLEHLEDASICVTQAHALYKKAAAKSG